MSEAQIPAESGGEREERDEKGRFRPGNSISKLGGRPRKIDLMSAVRREAEGQDIDIDAALAKLTLRMLTKGAQGDVAAAKLVLDKLTLDDKALAAIQVNIDQRGGGATAYAVEAEPEGPRESYEAISYCVLSALRMGAEIERTPRLSTVLRLAGFELRQRPGQELLPHEVDRAVAEAVEAAQSVVDADFREAPQDAPGGTSIEFVGDEPRADGVE